MSYTMHSPSQGFTNASADVYSSRTYANHLMTQNYSTYLSRDDPYNNGGGHYPNGASALPASHYPAGSSSLSQHTYPNLPPISNFPQHQDMYSSCLTPARNLNSYPSSAGQVSSIPLASSAVTRHTANSKAYWNCESVTQQNHCYPGNSISSSHKSTPQTWSHSPNVMSSPSSTPSPIPCPSTPHHFASSPHHSQSHTDNHKSYNGILNNNSSLASNGNAGANLNCNSNPLQSLQKMVQIEPDSSEIRVQYETGSVQSSIAIGSASQHPAAQVNQQIGSLEAETGYPTYYNLDQNRLCATPQSAYGSIATQALNSAPFSPTLKNPQEIRSQTLQGNCSKQESSSESGDLIRANSIRYANKLAKENVFLASRSCSTDTCSNGSPSAQSTKVASISEPAILPDQTHDSVASFRSSETTANSRDSAKSTDSDAMSSYAVSQCSTPSNTWKLNPAISQSNEFRQNEFISSTAGKPWWPENSISPSASRSFTPLMSECPQYNSSSVSYPSTQVSHQMHQANSTSSMSTSQPWSQQPTAPPPVGTTSQILSGVGFQTDGVVKKKRGRPFGSKNRRNLESSQQPTGLGADSAKRKRKTVLVDIGVNTSLSFDVQACLNFDDSYAHTEPAVKHSLPLVMKRKKVVGPVVRIDKSNASLGAQIKYNIVNAAKFGDEDKDSKVKPLQAKSCLDLASQCRKNGLARKCLNTNSGNAISASTDRSWCCVLCHKGPHFKGLGDLYGPYCITMDRSKLPTTLEGGDNSQENHDEAEGLEHACERRSLRRRVEPNAEESKTKQAPTHAAMEDDKECKVNLEVWIHEDCIVWSNNVYLDGTKIRNLEPAIVDSFNNVCTKCKLPGATLGCIYKNCNVSPLHYLCAKDKDCDLDEEKFILSCPKHKKRRITPKDLDVVEVSEATTTATNET